MAVAEVGSDATKPGAVQFYSIGNGTLTAIGAPVAVGKVPTGLSVNRTNHTVAVVNYQDQSVTVLPIPGAPVQAPGTPFTIDISNALQGQASPQPFPYAIGVDPDTNMALVAYSSTSASSARTWVSREFESEYTREQSIRIPLARRDSLDSVFLLKSL